MNPERTILHVDMDAFFAAVEQRDHPELRGLPVIVGAPPDQRGVVSTCSYEARRFGVHSAMPSRTAYRLCPQAVFLPVNGARYEEVSRKVFTIFDRFSPFVEGVSIDEAFLDISGSMHLFGGAVPTAERLRAAIRDEVGLTASVGLAPNKFLAKLASDMNKPDGLTVVPRSQLEIEQFLAPMPVGRLWGVGKVTAKQLHDLGFRTIADLQRRSSRDLERILGDRLGQHINELIRGRDERGVEQMEGEKSISHEHTFGEDCRDWARLEQVLLTLAELVGARLRAAGRQGRVVRIKLRWENFETLTRQRAMPTPVSTDREIIDAGLDLLKRERCPRAVRLIGVGVSDLVDPAKQACYQPDLFDQAPEGDRRQREERLDAAVDKLRKQFGQGSLRRGNWTHEE